MCVFVLCVLCVCLARVSFTLWCVSLSRFPSDVSVVDGVLCVCLQWDDCRCGDCVQCGGTKPLQKPETVPAPAAAAAGAGTVSGFCKGFVPPHCTQSPQRQSSHCRQTQSTPSTTLTSDGKRLNDTHQRVNETRARHTHNTHNTNTHTQTAQKHKKTQNQHRTGH